MFHDRRRLGAIQSKFVGAAGPSFPTLTHLIARWRADVGVTTSGSNVTSVADQSGGGNTLTASGGNVVLNGSGYNGKPTFSFTSANAGVLVANPINLTAFNSTDVTVYVIGQQASTTPGNSGCFTYCNTSASDFLTDGAFIGGDDGSSANFRCFAHGVANHALTMSDNAHHRFGLILNTNPGTACDVIIDGTAGTFASGAGISLIANGQFVVGARITTGAAATPFWEGLLSEIVVCNAILTATEITNLDNYFIAQWGL